MAEEEVNVNVYDQVYDSNGDQEVEDKCQVHDGDGEAKVSRYCNGVSHATDEEEDADRSYVFVSGSEGVAVDAAAVDDPRESDLNDNEPKTGEIVDDNGECLQAELSYEQPGGSNYSTEQDKFELDFKVDHRFEVVPPHESEVAVPEAAVPNCECNNSVKDHLDGSVVCARLAEEIQETAISSKISAESEQFQHVDCDTVARQSESASVTDRELKDVAGVDVKEKELSDEILSEAKPGNEPENVEAESGLDLTTDSCFVTDKKTDMVATNVPVSNENMDGLTFGSIQDTRSRAVDSNHIAGGHNTSYESFESELGIIDSNQQNGSIENAKISPVPVIGANASIESDECEPNDDKIQTSESSPGTECGKLEREKGDIIDSSGVHDGKCEIKPDNILSMDCDKPTFPLDDNEITNSGTSSIDLSRSGGKLDSDTETVGESHANTSIQNESNSRSCSIADVKLVPKGEKENLSALSSRRDMPADGKITSDRNDNVLEREGAPSADVPVKKEEEQDVTQEFEVLCDMQGNQDSRPTQEGSTADILDGRNMGAEVGKRPFYFLIRLPRPDDEDIKEQIKHAQFQVDEKTKGRDAIRAEIQFEKAALKECGQGVEAAISAQRSARELLKSKRQEMDSVQSMMNRLNNAISVGDIDGRIRNMEHMIEHETLPLKEEKQLLRQIKQLKQQREELSSNMGKHDQLQLRLDQKDSIEDHFKHLQMLRKEVESFRHDVLKAEAVTKAAKNKYDDEYNKLSEFLARFKAADNIRQEAYAKLQALRKQLYEKNKYFRDYKSAANKANELASKGNREELQGFCVNQVERIMGLWNQNDEFRREYVKSNTRSTLRRLKTLDGRSLGPDEEVGLWNQNDEFRREYVKSNTRSTLRRLKTLDGRSLGPDEEPPVIPNLLNERAIKNNSLSLLSTQELEKKAVSAETANVEDKPVSKVVVRSQTNRIKRLAKPAPLEESSVMVSSWDEAEDVRQEPKRPKEEEELFVKAEETRKEEEAAKLKEKRRLEEIAKAKEAMLRKKRNADKAQQRAVLKAQKEAEHKEKERGKKARKKERRKATAVDSAEDTGESATSSETPIRSLEECDHTEKPVEVTKKPQKPSHFVKQTKTKSIPLPLRNPGKRKMQSWMWIPITVLVVVALFFGGNSSLSLRSGLQGFGF
ncbi:hypothetical protein L6164_024976 [Bauhinia variegata]|uniref:Uncharacterized protein n=1 Tax=Bauhinia variegata TaxID=167791 RepID=A0ACB9M0I7_BAUVA|nr:hypothetical protein L6164_024976 [Bauhinia variegata]